MRTLLKIGIFGAAWFGASLLGFKSPDFFTGAWFGLYLIIIANLLVGGLDQLLDERA